MTTPEIRLAELDQAADDRAAFTSLGGKLSGAEVLDEVRATLAKYVIFPSEHAADAATLYAAATHAQPAWQSASRFIAKSAEKRCGKSRMFEVMRELVHNALPSANISTAALVRSISDEDPPTFIVDEADRLFGADRPSEATEILIGILNAGFARGWPYIRWDVTTRTREECPTFAMAMLASKGIDLPDTIEDRAIVVLMRRKAPSESVRPFRQRDIPALHLVRSRLHAWVTAHAKELEAAEPDMPVEDRAADVWESLVAIADQAGGYWPQRSRAAARLFVEDAEQDDAERSLGVRLLADIRDTFHDFGVSFLPSRELVVKLRAIDDSPWSDLELTMNGLSKRLKHYGIKPGKNSASTDRGYQLEWFLDAFTRYLPSADVRQAADLRKLTDTSKTEASDLQERGHPDLTSGRPEVSEGVRPDSYGHFTDTLETSAESEFSQVNGHGGHFDNSGHLGARKRVTDTSDPDDPGWPPGTIGAEVNAWPTPNVMPKQRRQP